MSISRKEFLTKGLAAFGRDLLTAGSGVQPDTACKTELVDDGPLLVDNGRCLSRRGGCFSCLDRCPREAIDMIAGVGIVVKTELCTSCGECIDVCPLEPKPITLKRVDAVKLTKEKGD